MAMRQVVGLVGAAVVVVASPGLSLGVASNSLSDHAGRSATRNFDHRPHGKIRIRALSAGGRAWFRGPATGGGEEPSEFKAGRIAFGSNVDANNPQRDLAAGQSETSVAAAGRTVVAAWNDASAFLVRPSTRPRASATGLGVSTDGGRHFRDLLGLRNDHVNEQWFGDPTVVRIDRHHFAIGSLYLPPNHIDCRVGHHTRFLLAVEMLTVKRNGKTVRGEPVVAANGGDLCSLFGRHRKIDRNLAFLDKPWLGYNAASRQLAVSYTRFFLGFGHHSGNGQIELVRAHVPANPVRLSRRAWTPPVRIWPEERTVENTGAYVSVAPNGDSYVSWERNVDSNLFGSSSPYVFIHAARVRVGHNTPVVGGRGNARVVTRGQRNSHGAGGVKSLDAVGIAGFSRFIGQDFPRIAFDAPLNKVVIVWNDASVHPLGDIWMRALPRNLALSGRIHKVNSDHTFALHFLPAVSVRSDGSIATSWYDRRRGGPQSTRTDYFGDIRRTPRSQARDFRITTGPSDWLGTSSLIDPNFGDYTDNASTGRKTYFTWSDGRIGVPQPFVDSRR
jgi:hypothetical protein